MAASTENTLCYEGCNFLRQRLILATLSGKSVKIKNIRPKGDEPGLKDFEMCFIRMLEKMTNGTVIKVSASGTGLSYRPGMLIGGTFQHDCNIQRGIGYYLESLLLLAPFTKMPTKAVLKGVTNDPVDPSVDLIKHSNIPVLHRFLGAYEDPLELKVIKRGAPPEGGGEVVFEAPCRQKLCTVNFVDTGKIKRIRGVAWATRMSPSMCNRMVEAARSILNKVLPDIYIYTDHRKGPESGKSPGFGMTLVAQTIGGSYLSAELMSNQAGQEATVPEDLGKQVAKLLMHEIYRGGCVDSNTQSLAVVLMTLGEKNVAKVKVGALSPCTIQYLRHIRDFFNVMFKTDVAKNDEDEDDDDEEGGVSMGGEEIILTCVGAGYRNIAKVTV